MSMKHTPGPWRDIGTMPSDEDPNNGERFIGQVLIGRDCGYGVACALPCGTPDLTPERTEANARLIAAAPDLAAALKTAKWMLERDYIDDQKMAVIEQCRTALVTAGIEE